MSTTPSSFLSAAGGWLAGAIVLVTALPGVVWSQDRPRVAQLAATPTSTSLCVDDPAGHQVEDVRARVAGMRIADGVTTIGRTSEEDHALLDALGMPVAEGPGEGRFIVDATGAHARPARKSIPVTSA